METLLVRLKPYDPRRGFVLRRFTYAGIKFQGERGWYRVEKSVAEYLKTVRQVHGDPHAALAFDVCTQQEAKALEASESDAAKARKSATDELKVSPARPTGTATTEDPPEATPTPPPAASSGNDKATRRGRKE